MEKIWSKTKINQVKNRVEKRLEFLNCKYCGSNEFELVQVWEYFGNRKKAYIECKKCKGTDEVEYPEIEPKKEEIMDETGQRIRLLEWDRERIGINFQDLRSTELSILKSQTEVKI